MRIILMGQAVFGEKVLQALSKKGEEVTGIYTPPDIPGRTNSLKELAVRLGIPIFQPKAMRAPEVYNGYVKLKPDLNVMAYVTDIIPHYSPSIEAAAPSTGRLSTARPRQVSVFSGPTRG